MNALALVSKRYQRGQLTDALAAHYMCVLRDKQISTLSTVHTLVS